MVSIPLSLKIIYAILGSSSQMVIGLEAVGSLLVGSVIRSSVDNNGSREGDNEMYPRIGGGITDMAGAVIFIAGLTRLGFEEHIIIA
jgi:MFS superfamily sulfate permease-like transporter